MFRKLKEWFQLNNAIAEKEKKIKQIDELLADKEKAKANIIAEAKLTAESDIREIAEEAIKRKRELEMVEQSLDKHQKEVDKLGRAAKKFKSESVGIKQLIEKFPQAVNLDMVQEELSLLEEAMGDGVLSTLVELNLHHQDSKLLRKEMTANNREIAKLLKAYEGRYSTKANKTIYHLMVIGLKAELQNILHKLKYANLDKSQDDAKALIDKYLTICGDGNANILPTITRFLSELEPLFRNAIQIEYKYYIQKEKEKEEQRLIKEQMKQEAEERKRLEEEKKKIEKEEGKYLTEIEKNTKLLENEQDETKIAALHARLAELNEQVEALEEQKSEIVKRANGRAGYVYVISNLGSFGENMFKVGMTRRLNPLDRIDELGNASVPFKFDIHAMVFSDNAVELEQKIHERLNAHRVNKINLRKEFFYSDVQQLQDIVQDIDETVEFKTTLLAEEFRQSQSIINEEEHTKEKTQIA
ncbi:GIY-YIG nuclease family protein [Alkalihalophilus marmarensis]|uniref:Chromosome segregation ATPase n=1 Tax=Alkalihalophilus marmarensis DSM 21297 TaxID=1188261 RepID=U6SRE1_9BACI|nr:GIY-YIG nuclease family protein [Alkalihalophilus marmarensis]ERN53917.1 chromosome segregation ATPase [Alkalihalophilus marmarensis DSM 21297]